MSIKIKTIGAPSVREDIQGFVNYSGVDLATGAIAYGSLVLSQEHSEFVEGEIARIYVHKDAYVKVKLSSVNQYIDGQWISLIDNTKER